MNRNKAMKELIACGYHNDKARATKILNESSISMRVYISQFQIGEKQYRKGNRCYCVKCQERRAIQ